MSIPADDRGFTLGHGLFETVLFERGSLQHWDAHLARLARGCAVLGMPSPDGEVCMAAALEAVGDMARGAVRVTWSAGSGGRGLDAPAELEPRLVVSAAPAAAPQGPAGLVTATVRRNDGSPAARLKTLSYLDNVLARAEARAAGADEALMLNTRGEVACAAAANLFWVAESRLFTPALECGVLDGITRGRVMDACAGLGVRCEEVRAGPGALDGASIFLTNSLIGLREVAGLDGRPAPPSALAAAFTKVLSA